MLVPSPAQLILNTTMATGGVGENFNPAYETFRKHSADLLTVIQDPEVLAWDLLSSLICCVPCEEREVLAGYLCFCVCLL